MNTKHSAPAFQVYPTRELSNLYGVTAEAHGIYSRLRAHFWLRRKLPTSPAALAKLAGVSLRAFRRAWTEIAEQFARRGASIVLPELVELQRDYDARAAERSASGDAGARSRWKGHVPKKPRSRWKVLVRLAHTTLTDGKLLEKFRGDDASMFEEFKTRAVKTGLWLSREDDPQWPRRAWEAARHEQVRQLRAKMQIARVAR